MRWKQDRSSELRLFGRLMMKVSSYDGLFVLFQQNFILTSYILSVLGLESVRSPGLRSPVHLYLDETTGFTCQSILRALWLSLLQLEYMLRPGNVSVGELELLFWASLWLDETKSNERLRAPIGCAGGKHGNERMPPRGGKTWKFKTILIIFLGGFLVS